MESVFKFWQKLDGKIRGMIPVQVFPAVVSDVDEKARTCKVKIADDVEYEDVRLYAVVDDSIKGFCLIPAVDSMVLVGRIGNGNELYVVSFSEVDKVLGTIGDNVEVAIDKESLSYKCDKTEATVKSNDIQVKTEQVTFTVSADQVTLKAPKVVFNDGGKGGLINIKDLATYIDDIADKFNNHTHTFATGTIAVEGTPAKQANAGPISTPALTSTVKKVAAEDYEDSTIEH